MQEYERQILVTSEGPEFPARLKVIRLPASWYAVVWERPERYATFSQDRTEKNGGHEHMSDEAFLARVRLVASFSFGIDFEWREQ
ncbi:hypothetical protein [Agrobacterium vitis]|uniref:hypothetical protein n=1 Tax=Agrobacterium vitis TaxID=373 RepID=UPI000760DB5E|nr:hypothetical protein [Agrobacterium vitis]